MILSSMSVSVVKKTLTITHREKKKHFDEKKTALHYL